MQTIDPALVTAFVAATTGQGVVDVADELGRGGVSHEVATHARPPAVIVPPPRRAP